MGYGGEVEEKGGGLGKGHVEVSGALSPVGLDHLSDEFWSEIISVGL